MAKRVSQDIKNKKSHSKKTAKRLAIKHAMLAGRKSKKKGKEKWQEEVGGINPFVAVARSEVGYCGFDSSFPRDTIIFYTP